MSGGPKRNPDKINTIGIVVVGVCGAVLVYVTITALQAFYMDDTSDVQTMADYGGNDETANVLKANQVDYINTYAPNSVAPGQDPTYRIAISQAIKKVGEAVKQPNSGAYLVPGMAPSITSTIEASFGRPKKLAQPAAGSGSDASSTGSAGSAGSAAPADAGSAAGSAATGSGSAAPATGSAGSAAPLTPTGAGSANVPGAQPAKKDEPKKDEPKKDDKAKGSAAPATPAKGSAAKGNGR